LTGFHEQEASHIDLLQTFAGEEGVKAIYKEAVAKCYLWHEFGDMNLIMKQARS
jgi:S-adenosylmethionine:tRNA ribosyltransferase-isomerase